MEKQCDVKWLVQEHNTMTPVIRNPTRKPSGNRALLTKKTSAFYYLFLCLFILEDHTEKRVKNIFEADIQLTKSDREGVDTKSVDSKDTADVDVDSVVTKRKAISSRRLLWVTKEVPVELGVSASKMSRNVLTPQGKGMFSEIFKNHHQIPYQTLCVER